MCSGVDVMLRALNSKGSYRYDPELIGPEKIKVTNLDSFQTVKREGSLRPEISV